MTFGNELAGVKQSLRDRPGYLLRRCLQETSRNFETACEDVGITERQYDYLFVLDQVDMMTQGDLSKVLDVDRSTNTLVIRILEKKGLVERWNHPADSRKKCLRLSNEGKAVLGITRPRAEQSAEKLLASLSILDASRLMTMLNTILDKSVEAD
ncbi:MAG: MarR family winged helix-turn-helix transcriptional regulator [Rhizobiaceae bacterium]